MKTLKVLILAGLLLVLLSGCVLPTPCPPCPTAVPTSTVAVPTATATAVPTATPTPGYLTCVDPRFEEMGVIVNVRPAARYKLIAAWAWFNGDVTTAPACARQWMNFPSVGADHSVFGVIVGTAQPADFRLWWSTEDTIRSAAGWIDIPIFARFDVKGGGPYNFRFDGGDEILKVGLWKGVHTSWAGVWIDTQPVMTSIDRPATADELLNKMPPAPTPEP